MRVLYVALTRAKEKLIITGTVKDYQKEQDKKKELLKIYKNKDKINPILLKKYISYLDWIELVALNNKLDNLITINVYSKNKIVQKEEKEINIREFDFEKVTDFEKYEEELNWKYDKKIATELPIKSTVSKVKEMKNDLILLDELSNKDIELNLVTPNFIEMEKITSARKGTLMHLFLQNIDFNLEYNIAELEKLKETLIMKKIVSDEEAEFINLEKIHMFLKSDLANKIRKAKLVEKEKAFCKKIMANEIFEDAKDETILVQGIIDLYAVTENNEIILVDYKTDFVEYENILIGKYSNQLKIYKQALEEALNKKVTQVYIYSMYLNKEIAVDLNYL